MVKKLSNFPQECELLYATEFSSGVDLIASIDEDILLNPSERILIPTGIVIQPPKDFESQIRPRSGLALKHGITVLNSPGTIDNDYRGEIKVILINLGCDTFTISRGMRIAQLVFCSVSRANLLYVEVLSETTRDDGGFGSTGV